MSAAAAASVPVSDVEHRASGWERVVSALEVLALAILVSAVVVALLGHDPFRTLAAVVHGAFGTGPSIHATLLETVPLIFAGLAVALPLRLGLFNIGAEGQLILGGLAAGLVAATAPAALVIPAAVLAAVLMGGIWGAVPGVLRARLGVHEVLSTILLNLVAIPLAALVVSQPWAQAEGDILQTEVARATLPHLYPALASAVLVAVGYDIWLSRTRSGLTARAIGFAPRASQVLGLPVRRGIFWSLTAAGAFAGLVGAQQVLDQHGRYVDGFSPGFGFTAIAVALLGRGSGVGVVLAALALGALRSGAFAMDALGVAPRETAAIVQGVVILVAAAVAAPRLGGTA
jgi:simple sugar transport system permease protein